MLTRREFLRLCLGAASALSISRSLISMLCGAIESGEIERPKLIWLEACTCSGNILSAANSVDPDLYSTLTDLVDLRYAALFMPSEGEMALEQLYSTAENEMGRYIFVVEGTIPTRDNGYFMVIGKRGGEAITALEAVRYLADRAKFVIAAGTCASFGGIYSSRPNPSESKGVQDIWNGSVINVPGCPVHPDWVLGTISHLVFYGPPKLDSFGRPRLFYGETVHQGCPRRDDYAEGNFAKSLGDDGCYYMIGCKGPVTNADCPTRQWNNHKNWPIGANSPCIGCASPEFVDGLGPVFSHLPDLHLPYVTLSATRLAQALGIGTAIALSGHLAGNIITGRLRSRIDSRRKLSRIKLLRRYSDTAEYQRESGSHGKRKGFIGFIKRLFKRRRKKGPEKNKDDMKSNKKRHGKDDGES